MPIHSAINVKGCTVVLLITIALTFAFLGSCCSRDSSEVHSTVKRFITALIEGDRATIALIAPGVSSDTKLEQVLSMLAGIKSWSITEIECRSGSAQARVTIFHQRSRNGSSGSIKPYRRYLDCG